jgi:signal transduction histidine kinase
MRPRSIRWRLPFSYAAIALLAVLLLGAVLLTTLRRYYAQRELDYLTANAQAAGEIVTRMLEENAPPAALQSQLESLAFLSQTRVRLLDKTGQTLADSGDPLKEHRPIALSVIGDSPAPPLLTLEERPDGADPTDVQFKIESQAIVPSLFFTQTMMEIADKRDYTALILIEAREFITDSSIVGGAEVNLPDVIVTNDPLVGQTRFLYRTRTSSTPYGFDLSAETATDGRRSRQMIQQSFYDPDGKLLGYVELSKGPAYGQQILDSVTRGWIIAGSVAVLLAAGVGWAMSRRISTPLLVLTGVTSDMAQGDLSARADMTRQDELGLLARSFNEMAGQVQETIVALRRFVADAAHELHTPLTALRTNLELAADERDQGRQRDFVARAQAQVERLDALTRSLLNLSQLESGVVQEAAAPVELSALVRETSEPYASRAEQAGLVFALDLPGAPVTVQGERGQLRRALGNLLDNALKFTPEGGGVRVGLRQEGAWASLWVQDTGIGVPAEDLPGLFERFHRGRNATPYPGSGLGLAIVKAVVQRHGGQVVAQNMEQGARFTLRLPTAIAHLSKK